MGFGTVRGKPASRLIHHLSFGLPAAFHDVTDFPHPADISVADALPVRAAVAISEAAATGGLQDRLLLRRGAAHCAAELGSHVAVERRQSRVSADRDLPLGPGLV